LNSFTIGRRIPIGGAVNGLINGSAILWNALHPIDQQIPIAAVAALSVPLTMIAQILVVRFMGVTHVGDDKE
jgi:hypothetical protein